MHLDVLGSLAEVDAVAPEWRALDLRPQDGAAYFQSFDWCRAWLQQVAPQAGSLQPYIVTVRVGERLAAVLPLMLRSGPGGVRVLSALGEPHTQYSGLLADRDLFDDAAARLLSDGLRRAPCDLMHVSLVPAGSTLDRVLGASMQAAASDNVSSEMDLTRFADVAAYLASFDGRRKKSRARRWRQLEQLGPVRLRAVWPDEPDYPGIVRACVAMKQRWLLETGRMSRGFALAGFADLLRSLPGDRATKEGAVALALEAGGRLVAAEVSMIRRGRLYSFVGGFDGDLRSASPGKAQMEAAICWAIENGLTTYDLLGNKAAYKDSWSNRETRLNTYTRAITAKGWAFERVWLGAVRPRLKQVFDALPTAIRQRAGRRQLVHAKA